MTDRNKNNGTTGCFRCRHFYTTWDEAFPRGCRAYGFKTRNIPAMDVLSSSGMPCLKFEGKKK